MKAPAYMAIGVLLTLAPVVVAAALRNEYALWLIVFLSAVILLLSGFILGNLCHRRNRAMLQKVANYLPIAIEQILSLLQSGQAEHLQQIAMLSDIHQRVQGTPAQASNEQLQRYLYKLEQQQAVRSADHFELILLLCEAIEAGHYQIQLDGHCHCCLSQDPLLKEHINLASAHREGCPIPKQSQLVADVKSVLSPTSITAA